ncbi:translation initiation factor 2 [Pseudomonas sp. Fl5BN2]|uniref:translation initiation factor 2 n=1 Tax=unclassified Pseudomonas TaxID=196821 RepID=UPI001378C787|nr:MULTISPECIES: translation initiation factor 2 [unclassified Pseudomonas]NBF01269.1 translation initiation factor 2 [Pseudomonas sp. Fl5BN2]NBF12961.1 translation initiation factor 2 [Pseudomonas sp. Fl4BN1]
MKAFLPAFWLCVCLLGVAPVTSVQADSASDKPAASSSHPSKPTTTKKTPASKNKAPASAAKAKPANKKATSKSKWAYQDIKTPLTSPKLDLSLPPEMVKHLQPVGSVPLPKREPLLPQMFGEKPKESSPFQLNGRLLSNEMQLQLRNEERREIEGAALDFEFKQ